MKWKSQDSKYDINTMSIARRLFTSVPSTPRRSVKGCSGICGVAVNFFPVIKKYVFEFKLIVELRWSIWVENPVFNYESRCIIIKKKKTYFEEGVLAFIPYT